MARLGPTLYEAMLAKNAQISARNDVLRKESADAKKQEHAEYKDSELRLLERDRFDEEKKQNDFMRKTKLAEMGGQGAGAIGAPTPQFEDAAVQEHADMAYLVGGGDRQKMAQEEFLRNMGFDLQRDNIDAQNERARLSREAATERADARLKDNRSARSQQEAFKIAALEKGVRAELEKYPESKMLTDAVAANNNLQLAVKSGAGSLALVNGFAKLIDPGSRAVTDADVRLGISAQGLPDRVKNIVSKVSTGELVGPALRAEIQKQAAIYVQQRQKEYDTRASVLRATIAQGNLINPDFAVPTYDRHIVPLGGGEAGVSGGEPGGRFNMHEEDEEDDENGRQ